MATKETLDRLRAAEAAFVAYVTAMAGLQNTWADGGLPGSIAEQQFSRADRVVIANAYTSASFALTSANHHLFASWKLAVPDPVPFAVYTVGRSVLEASALSMWFTDPTIDGVERIRRGILHRHYGMSELRKFTKDQTHPKQAQNHQHSNARLQNVSAQARNYGVALPTKGRGMPSVTSLVEDYLQGKSDYRLLSAGVHGQSWATMGLSMVLATSGPDENGDKRAQPEISDLVLHELLHMTVKAHCRAFQSAANFFDVSANPVKDALEPLAVQLASAAKASGTRA